MASVGGGTDTVSRLICDQLSKILGQTFVVENKGGAGGNIGTAELARAVPDGYTLGLITVASHTLNPMLYSRLPYNPDKDIVGVSRVALLANLLGRPLAEVLGLAFARTIVALGQAISIAKAVAAQPQAPAAAFECRRKRTVVDELSPNGRESADLTLRLRLDQHPPAGRRCNGARDHDGLEFPQGRVNPRPFSGRFVLLDGGQGQSKAR